MLFVLHPSNEVVHPSNEVVHIDDFCDGQNCRNIVDLAIKIDNFSYCSSFVRQNNILP